MFKSPSGNYISHASKYWGQLNINTPNSQGARSFGKLYVYIIKGE